MHPEHLQKQLSVLVQRSLFRDIFKPSPDDTDVPGKEGQGSWGVDALVWVLAPILGLYLEVFPAFPYLASSSFSMARWSKTFLSFSWAISSTRALEKEHRWPMVLTLPPHHPLQEWEGEHSFPEPDVLSTQDCLRHRHPRLQHIISWKQETWKSKDVYAPSLIGRWNSTMMCNFYAN